MSVTDEIETPSSALPPGIEAGYWRLSAPPDLRAFFTDIVGYEERFHQIVRQVETASLATPLILSFGDPFEIGLGHFPGRDDAVPSFLAGLGSSPVFIQSYGRARCLQINFTPLGARRFFRLPMHCLTDRMVPAGDVADAELRDLICRIEDMTNWTERLAHALHFVSGRFRAGSVRPGPTDHVYRRLLETGGQASIKSLSEEIGWSRKHLAQKFREDIGLRPKAVARLARFGRVLRAARTGRVANWAALAIDCGYADQAHLIRDFSEFSGQPPSAWLARQQANAAPVW